MSSLSVAALAAIFVLWLLETRMVTPPAQPRQPSDKAEPPPRS